jgi:hypothetical protein
VTLPQIVGLCLLLVLGPAIVRQWRIGLRQARRSKVRILYRAPGLSTARQQVARRRLALKYLAGWR